MNRNMLDTEILAALRLRGSSSVRIITNSIQEGRKTTGQVWSPLSNATVRSRLLDMEERGIVKRQNSGLGERHWWVAV